MDCRKRTRRIESRSQAESLPRKVVGRDLFRTNGLHRLLVNVRCDSGFLLLKDGLQLLKYLVG